MLEKRLRLPVILETDVKASIMEEQLWAKDLIEELSGYLAILINECLIYQNSDILILARRTIQELTFLLEKALEKKEYFHTYLLERTKIIISKGNGMESVKENRQKIMEVL